MLTMDALNRAMDGYSKAAASVDGGYVMFVHPAQEAGLRRMWAVEHGSPIQRHATHGGMRARRRQRLAAWRPNHIPRVLYGAERIVVAQLPTEV